MSLDRPDVEDVYALSPMQEGMLFHTLHDPTAALYFHQTVIGLGDTDQDAFRRAWQAVTERHPILRTSFHWEGLEKAIQVVHRDVKVELDVHDWEHLSEEEQGAELRKFLRQDRERGLSLNQVPAQRLALFRMGPGDHRFVWSHHHILMDGWSAPIVLREVHTHYDAFRRGQDVHLPRPRPFRDYVAWLQRQDLAEAEAFWRRTFEGFSVPTPLPGDAPSGTPRGRGERFDQQQIDLSPAATAALDGLARGRQITLNTIVQAAWALLLRHWTGMNDVAFGAVVSGRTPELDGIEGMVGLFINTLPVRIRVDEEASLGDWLRTLQKEQAERGQYEYSPLVQVHQWSGVPTRTALFETMVVFGNTPQAGEGRGRPGKAPKGRRANLGEHRTEVPLHLSVVPDADRLYLQLIFDGARLDGAVVARMLGHLQNILEQMAAHPDRRVGDVSLISAAEREKLLVEWNDTAADYPQACLHELFEEQVARTPDAIALSWEDQDLAYDDLNRRANRLANYLLSRGIGRDSLVGVCVERSPEMVVALLGILKTGAAYLPLDPAYPQDRLSYMLADSGAEALVTLDRLAGLLPIDAVQTIRLDADEEALAAASDENPPSRSMPDDVAYVIYTSGSTGRPKGVQGTHRGAVNRCAWMWRTYPFEAREVACQKTALSFVDSVWEIFGPLLRGVRNVILPDALVKDALQLVRRLGALRVTRIVLVPSLLRSMLETGLGLGTSLPDLRLWVSSGEALSRDLADRFRQEAPSAILVNLYGSSEAAADVTCYDTQWGLPRHAVPIGRPIANSQAYILDRRFQPVAIGVPGELYVAGDGLARGYHERPDLTAERFLPNPFSAMPGGRLYKTGDLGRWMPDGNIEYLGRVDHQVKVRGFRIELGEIEKTLAAFPGVREGAVVIREIEPGESRLIAYAEPREGFALASTDLQDFLKLRLPDYMVPSAFVVLDALPRTPSGKLDRTALPALDGDRAESAQEYVAPRTATEETIAAMWAELLGVERVGIRDNFFELGGHSLLATRAASRLRTTLGIEVPLRGFFDAPTVAGLAAVVEANRDKAVATATPPPIEAAEPMKEVPLSFSQQRLWFLDQLDPGSPAYTIAQPIRLRGPISVPALEEALSEVVRRHESLRTTFNSRGGRPFQVVHAPAPVRMPLIDLSGIDPSEREGRMRQHMREQARQPWSLSQGPLLRVRLLRLDEEQHLLNVTMHHIVSDGMSKAVFAREIGTLHRAFADGRPSPLPDLPLQYADYAIWQRQWLQGDAFDEHLAYWREKLGGSEPLDLPTDFPRPAVQRPTGGRQKFEIGAEATGRMHELAVREGVSMFMPLLAVFQLFLARYSGQEDVSVGTPVANRNRAELEKVIGFFVNTLVMRTNLRGATTFRDLLGRVRETCLGAYDHQDVPFEKLVEELQPDRDLSRQPLFQALFVMGNNGPQAGGNAGAAETLIAEMEVTNFDLTMLLGENEQGLFGSLQYNTDLFEPATAERMAAHFRDLLEAVVADPDAPLARIGALDGPARRRALEDWQGPVVDFPRDRCVHELFEDRARHAPDHPAVVGDGRVTTYGELDRRANRLAHALRREGVGPEQVVGALLKKSPEAIVALLGILKAGGAYLPLDPASPRERLSAILQDAAPIVLLCDDELAASLADLGANVMVVDRENVERSEESAEKPETSVGPRNLAYVIYTSGSTGTPKGVLVEHQGFVNLVTAQIPLFEVGPESRVLQMISLTFDASLGEIFRALASGATLYQPSAEASLPGPELLRLLQEERISVVSLPPSLLMAMPEGTRLPDLRTLTVGGEACPPELALRWGQGRRLLNGYGPTETTVGATLAIDWPAGKKPPLGRPLPNVRTYVLDRDLRLAPPGVPGELYIGGAGVARGYLNDPARTAERFLPDPFAGSDSARMYRTGDRARWLPSGDLDFLGRMDQQVKIRGFRIELGEIEAALAKHPAVKACAVEVRDDGRGNKVLVGYLTARENAAPATAELRGFLKDRLPDYMVPAAFTILAALPLTTNGKIDRRALPAPDFKSRASENYEAPRNEIETILAGVWADVLKLDRVGVHDNFFELGGDSIRSIQVIARAGDAGVRLTPKDLFQRQTIAELAALAPTAELTARKGPTSGTAPLTPIQRWFFDQAHDDPRRVVQSAFLSGMPDMDFALLERALRLTVDHHDSLRSRFRLEADGWRQSIVPPGDAAPAEFVDLSELTPEDQDARLTEVAARLEESLDLAEGPLVRLAWFHFGPERAGRLFLVVHRLVADSASWRILVEDLSAAYRQLQIAETPKLPPTTASYMQWAERLATYATSDELKQEESYWLDPTRRDFARLPVDFPGGANDADSADSVEIALSASDTAALRGAVPPNTRTGLAEVLLAALGRTLIEWTGGRTLLVDVHGEGREESFKDVNLSRTVGWYSGFHPQLLNFAQEESIADILKAVREQFRRTPRQGLGYLVSRYLGPDSSVRERLAELPAAEVALYVSGPGAGRSDRDAADSSPIARHVKQRQEGPRRYLVELSAAVRNGTLRLRWKYGRELHDRSTIERMAQVHGDALREILAAPPVAGPTDFLGANLSPEELAALFAQLSQGKS